MWPFLPVLVLSKVMQGLCLKETETWYILRKKRRSAIKYFFSMLYPELFVHRNFNTVLDLRTINISYMKFQNLFLVIKDSLR